METIEQIKDIIDKDGYYEYKNGYKITYKQKKVWNKPKKDDCDYEWVDIKSTFEVSGYHIIRPCEFKSIEKCIEEIDFMVKFFDPNSPFYAGKLSS